MLPECSIFILIENIIAYFTNSHRYPLDITKTLEKQIHMLRLNNEPNLQNIPIRTERGRRVRQAFIPRDVNHWLLSADYSQVELRLVAHMAKEESMLDAFAQGKDILKYKQRLYPRFAPHRGVAST